MTTIAVGVDDSPHADLAVRWAVQEVRLRGAELELIHAYVMYFTGTEAPASHELAEPVMDRIVERNRDVLDTVRWTTTLVPVTVVHGYPEPAFLMHAGLQSDANLRHARTTARERAVAVVDSALAAVDVPSGIQVDRAAAAGPAAGLLLERAGADALLVVGTRGRGAVRQMLVGSVTHQCLHHATGTVAVVL